MGISAEAFGGCRFSVLPLATVFEGLGCKFPVSSFSSIGTDTILDFTVLGTASDMIFDPWEFLKSRISNLNGI